MTDRALLDLAESLAPPSAERWVRRHLGDHLWSAQVAIAESVQTHRRTAVTSAHACGKSAAAARIGAWWVATHPPEETFLVWTAPTYPQVHAILGEELRAIHSRAGLPGRFGVDDTWRIGTRLVAQGRKPADHDEHGLQGLHRRYVLAIIDEASGVPRQLWNAVEAITTSETCRILAIGNPDDPASEFAEVCKPGSGWNVIHVDGLETPNFTGEDVPDSLRGLLISPEWVEDKRRRWGGDSPLFVSKVRGRFPEVGDDTLISPRMVLDAQARELPGLEAGVFGVDPARFGSDQTAIYRNRGGVIREIAVFGGADTMQTTGRVARILRENPAATAVVDVVGLGAGVFDRLAEQRLSVVPFGAGERAHERSRFLNRRAEAFWAFREMLLDGLVDLDPADDELAAQLQSVRYRIASDGRIALESKEDSRRRGLPSPDRADAAVMSTVLGTGWGGQPWAAAHVPAGPMFPLTGDLLDRRM